MVIYLRGICALRYCNTSVTKKANFSLLNRKICESRNICQKGAVLKKDDVKNCLTLLESSHAKPQEGKFRNGA